MPATRRPAPNVQAPFTASEAWALAGVLALAGALRVWHLDRNGFGNAYYAAAVRSMLLSWKNFFFVSFDPAGWVTVDKPPLALWIQAASAKAFGYSGLSILLPQAAEGVAGVALLYALVRRAFDRASALASALCLAVCPLSVAVDRYNNVDACLVLVLLAAAFAVGRAVEGGRRRWLLAAAVLGGLAFNTKMLMGLIFLPAFYAAYLFGAPGNLRRRLKELVLASLVLALVSLSWILTVDWTPPAKRPFVGSSKGNSMVELAFFGWNGLQRFSRAYGRKAAPENGDAPLNAPAGSVKFQAGAGASAVSGAAAPDGLRRPSDPSGLDSPRPQRLGGHFMGGSPPGPWRLADPAWAGQVLWFLPLALLGLGAATRRKTGRSSPARRVPAPRGTPSGFRALLTAPLRLRQSLAGRPDRQSLFFWACWLAVHAFVFSSFSVVHTYYLVLLAPALAVLGGAGLRALWLEHQDGRGALLPVTLLVTALWQQAILAQNPDWSAALLPLLAGGTALAALGLSLAPRKEAAEGSDGLSWARVSLGVGALALLACPLGWALTPVLSPTGDGSVQADPVLLTGPAYPEPGNTGGWAGRGNRDPLRSDKRLLAFLQEHRGRAEYLVAAQNSQAVAPFIIASGDPAVSVGGFMGGDPIISVEQFAEKVRAGELRYFLLTQRPTGRAGAGRQGGRARSAWGPRGGNAEAIAGWVRAHGRPVDPSLWRTPESSLSYGSESGWGGGRGAGLSLYDLGTPDAFLGSRHPFRRRRVKKA